MKLDAGWGSIKGFSSDAIEILHRIGWFEYINSAAKPYPAGFDAGVQMEEKMDCEGCGETIPPRRLKVVPGCTTCVGCQETAEKEGRFVRHQMDIAPSIESWQCTGVEQKLVKGTDV